MQINPDIVCHVPDYESVVEFQEETSAYTWRDLFTNKLLVEIPLDFRCANNVVEQVYLKYQCYINICLRIIRIAINNAYDNSHSYE